MKHAIAIRIFLCFASGYFLSYAFRSINAVIAPVLLQELGLSNGDLGLLTAAYFVSFASMQLPLGIWLDKYGPRKTEAALLVFAASGAAIFALSSSLFSLWIGRALIGIGVSACLMAPFKAFRQYFAPEKQSQLASWMLVAGTSGALIATVPVSVAVPIIGWRGVFWLMSICILLVAVAIFTLLSKVETEHNAKTALLSSDANTATTENNIGYKHIFGNSYFRRMALLGFVNQATFLAMQSLWAGPWMMTVLGMNKEQTGQILFVFNFCLMLGYLALGWFAPRYLSQNSKRGWTVEQVVSIGLAASLIAQCGILTISAAWAWILWVVYAIFITVTTLIQTHVSMSFPAYLAGRANSAYNLILFSGVFIMQWGMGLLIDNFKNYGLISSHAMQAAFGVLIAIQAGTLFSFITNKAQAIPPNT